MPSYSESGGIRLTGSKALYHNVVTTVRVYFKQGQRFPR